MDALAAELVILVLVSVESVYELGAAACVSWEFRLKFVERALRMRAGERGETVEDMLPAGEANWVQVLCWRERRRVPQCVAAAGAMHSAFADPHGRLLTCGEDMHQFGFLGQGEATSTVLPTPVPRSTRATARVVAVAAHSMHTLALTRDGDVYSFGHGGCGKLGHGDELGLCVPRRIAWLDGIRVVEITAGQQHNLVLSDAGVVFSFGSGFGGKLGHGNQFNQLQPKRIESLERVATVAAGAFHSLVAGAADGALYSFGYGAMGQLGHGGREEELSPRAVAALAGTRVVGLAGGEHHSLVVDDSGAVYSFGAGEASERAGWLGGWLGHGSLEEQRVPKRIQALRGKRVVAVAAGSRHSLVLVDGGVVYSFGDGDGGKLGHGDVRFQWVPTRLHSLAAERVVCITAGESHSLCVLSDGRVFGWGSGAVGLGPQLTEYPPVQFGSAGNYEWAPGDGLLNRQARTPLLLQFPTAAATSTAA